MNEKWLFFDIGSTLVDETKCYRKRYEEVVKDSDVSIEEFTDKVLEFAQQKKSAFIEAMNYYGLKNPGWHSELETVYDDAKSVLSKLSEEYHIGIIANQSPQSKERLDKFGIGQLIELVVASAEEGVEKPNQRIFEIALERANCNAKNAVMIGDRLDNDIIPAKKIGMRTIWIKQGFAIYQSADDENEKADFEINSLGEILRLKDNIW